MTFQPFVLSHSWDKLYGFIPISVAAITKSPTVAFCSVWCTQFMIYYCNCISYSNTESFIRCCVIPVILSSWSVTSLLNMFGTLWLYKVLLFGEALDNNCRYHFVPVVLLCLCPQSQTDAVQWHNLGKVREITQFPGLDTWIPSALVRHWIRSTSMWCHIHALTVIAHMFVWPVLINLCVCYVCPLVRSRSQPVCWVQPSSVPWALLSSTATTSLWSTPLLRWVRLLNCLAGPLVKNHHWFLLLC